MTLIVLAEDFGIEGCIQEASSLNWQFQRPIRRPPLWAEESFPGSAGIVAAHFSKSFRAMIEVHNSLIIGESVVNLLLQWLRRQ